MNHNTLKRAFFEDYYRCYNSESPDALRQFYHPDVRLSSPQGTQVGADSIIETYTQLIAAFHDRMTAETILIEGHRAAVEIIDSFTAKVDIDDFMGQALKTGENLILPLCAVYTVENGQITTANIYRR